MTLECSHRHIAVSASRHKRTDSFPLLQRLLLIPTAAQPIACYNVSVPVPAADPTDPLRARSVQIVAGAVGLRPHHLICRSQRVATDPLPRSLPPNRASALDRGCKRSTIKATPHHQHTANIHSQSQINHQRMNRCCGGGTINHCLHLMSHLLRRRRQIKSRLVRVANK